MIDERQRVLAHNLIHNAVQLQKGEKVWINLVDCDASIACALVEQTYAAGGYPFVVQTDSRVQRLVMQAMTREQAELKAELDRHKMEQMDAYIGIRGSDNIFESVDIPEEINRMYDLVYTCLLYTSKSHGSRENVGNGALEMSIHV